MSQRNPMNERYTTDKVQGKTRKSAASAKPSSKRAATVRDAAPKSKKEKKKENKAREAEQAAKRGTTTASAYVQKEAELKKWKRVWIACISFCIALTSVSLVVSLQMPDNSGPSFIILMLAFGVLLIGFYIDSTKIKPMRTQQYVMEHGKSKKARAIQKQARAEARELKKKEETDKTSE